MALSTASLSGRWPVTNHLKWTFNELLMEIRIGNINNVRNVASAIPYAILIAMGIRNCACRLVSNINGAKPAIVVMDVRNMALKRDFPA